MGSLVNVSANTFALAYHGYRDHQNSGYSWGHKIITFSVDDDGKILRASLHCITIRRPAVMGYGADFVKIDEDSYALAYRTYNLSRWMAKVKHSRSAPMANRSFKKANRRSLKVRRVAT